MKIVMIFVFLTSILFGAVDINHANAEELATLKGIGKKKAAKIIKYRKKHGCFKSMKQFRKVKGIKKKTIKKNKGNIVLGECKKAQ
jgi:competence protein ComEA